MTLGLRNGTVRVVPYDPAWADAFAEEHARLMAALGGVPATLEHIGSTSVPGLAAKPILDLMGGRPEGSALEPYVAAFTGAGYEYRGEYGIPGREYFIREDAQGLRTHHLHLVVIGGEFWARHLAFRDALRRDPARAAEYAALKRALAARHESDWADYTDAKTDFIAETVRRATEGGGG